MNYQACYADSEVAVKRASPNGVATPSAEETGSISKNVPVRMTARKLPIMIWKEEILSSLVIRIDASSV